MEHNIPIALQPFKQKAWKPIIEDKDGSLRVSKFSGIPYLKPDEEYPKCQNCQKPMQLFIQLNLDELPESLSGKYGAGLLQLFYCTSENPDCEVECEAFFPFAKSMLVRVVEPDNHASDLQSPG